MQFYFARANYQSATIVILGIPFDRTSSFIPGARFAPLNIRIGAENIEDYSPYQKKSLVKKKIYDAGDFIPESFGEDYFQKVSEKLKSFILDGKKVIALGGEHTITIPCVKAYKEFYPNLTCIHLDAHSDMRDEYLGEKVCHATAARRISEIVGKENLFSLGIRSLTSDCRSAKNIYLFKVLEPLKVIKGIIKRRPCYLTLDCDVLDCGLFPAVSTPEPNGVSFNELIAAIKELTNFFLVGADIVEYNPLANSSLAYSSSVAVMVRELILALSSKSTKSGR